MRCGSLCICVCSKFPGVCFCQKLTKLDDIWLSYNKYKKGDVFFETQCIYSFVHTFIHLHIHTFIHTFTYSHIHPFTHPSIYTFIYLHIHTSIHPSIYLFIRPHIHSFTHSLIHSFIHTCIHSHIRTFIHTSIHSHIHPFTHSFIYTSIHPSIYLSIHSFGLLCAVSARNEAGCLTAVHTTPISNLSANIASRSCPQTRPGAHHYPLTLFTSEINLIYSCVFEQYVISIRFGLECIMWV